jgi:hypothetical protein
MENKNDVPKDSCIDALTFVPYFICKNRLRRLHICRKRIHRFFSRKSEVGIGDLRYSYRQLRKIAAECKYPLNETMWNGNTLGAFVTYVMEIILKRKRRSRRKIRPVPATT